LVRALLNLPLLPVKIVCLPLLLQLLPRCAMQPVNLRSYIAAKEISESALLWPNVYQVYVTLFRLAHRSQCKQALLLKFYWLGKIPKKFIADLRTLDLPPHIYQLIAAAVGRNLLESAKPALHQLARQLRALMEKLLQRFRSLVLLND
jgi:hypothetical protein